MAQYVQNLWYVAAWEEEVQDHRLFARTLLDQKVLVFRKQDRAGYVMLADRCPHRFAPLSRGALEGDSVVCPYHGLAFDETGLCVQNPFSDTPPKSAKVASYPVVARHGLIWFWPGEAAKADADQIPDFSWLDGQDRKRGRSTFAGHYELLTDNLMDLSHVEFIHRGTFHPNGAAFRGEHDVHEAEGGAIWSNWRLPAVSKPPFLTGMALENEDVDQYLDMRWQAPATMMLDIRWVRSGASRREALVQDVAPHIITPETAATSHYFWTCQPTPEGEALADVVFNDEDKPMIEAVQAAMGDAEFWDLGPVILKGDAAAIYARRRLMQMRRDESACRQKDTLEAP